MKIEDLSEKFLNYRTYNPEKAYAEYMERRTKLYEGLITSYSVKTVIEKLAKYGIRSSYEVSGVIIYEPLTPKQVDSFKTLLNQSGWFVSVPTDLNFDNYSRFEEFGKNNDFIRIEPKYSSKIANFRNSLYHIAPKAARDSINAIGLVAKARNKLAKHPERLYFATSLQDAYSMASQLRHEYFDCWELTPKHAKDYIWHIDPNFSDERTKTAYGVYSLASMPWFKLKLMEYEERKSVFGNLAKPDKDSKFFQDKFKEKSLKNKKQ